MHLRRDAVRRIVVLALAAAGSLTGLALAGSRFWECNWCHQQYQGDSPPRFARCPAKEMKQTHWWIEKRQP